MLERALHLAVLVLLPVGGQDRLQRWDDSSTDQSFEAVEVIVELRSMVSALM